MAGAAVHIRHSTFQKSRKLSLLFRRKILYDLLFDVLNGLQNLLMALQSFWQDVNAFTAAVFLVRFQFDETFLFQPAQGAGNAGMAEVEMFFQIFTAGRFGTVSQKTHNVSLGGCQVHFQ